MEYKIEPVYIERYLILVTYLGNDKIQEKFVKLNYNYRNNFYLEGFYYHPNKGSVFYTEKDAKEALIQIVTNTSFNFTGGYIYTIMSADLEGNLEEVRSYKELYWCDHIINHEPYSLDKKLSNDIPGIYITFQKVPENVVKEIQRRKVQEKLSEILQENS